jgi:two-component system cell cycle response regulator CtrA
MKILIVEDETGCATVVRRFLEPYSSMVQHAETLHDALRYVKTFQFDLIVLDLRLKDSDADKTINTIPDLRAIQEHAGIVVISGLYPVDEYKEKALENGADAYVPKGPDFTAEAIYVATFAAVKQRNNGDTADRIMHQIEMLGKFAEA